MVVAMLAAIFGLFRVTGTMVAVMMMVVVVVGSSIRIAGAGLSA